MNKFDDNFKEKAIELVIEEKMSIRQVAQDLGIGLSTLHDWIHRHKNGKLFKSSKLKEKEEEIKRLRKENKILRQEREILKKAMGIFSSTSKTSILL